jgi:hypothetical protein
MRFYLMPKSAGRPRQLFHTKHGFGAEAKSRGIKSLAEENMVEIPTHSAGLQDYVNGLLAEADSQPQQAQPLNEVYKCPVVPVAALTWADKPAPLLFPGTLACDHFVDAIADMDARDLSNVAEAVAHRFEQIAKEAAT